MERERGRERDNEGGGDWKTGRKNGRMKIAHARVLAPE